MIKTSIIVPVFNEEGVVEKVMADIKKYINQECEIIVVNDGSTDRTKDLLERIPDIKVISHSKNCGYGAALKSGIRKSQGEYILIIDADGSYPVKSIPELISQIGDYDMVVGARTKPQNQIPISRKPTKYLLNKLANYLTGTKIPDLNSGLRIIKKKLINQFFRFLPDGFSFTTTITLALLTNGYQVKYIPIDYYKRDGKSKIRPVRDTMNFLQLIIKTVLYFNPLKIFIPLGLILLLSGLLVFIYSYLFAPKIMDVTIVILFVSAIQVMAIGMIADLIIKRI